MPTATETRNRIFDEFVNRADADIGDRIPTIRALSGRYGVSAPTIGRAVEILASEGWLRKRQGSGMFVANTPHLSPPGQGREASDAGRPRIGYVAVNFHQPLAHKLLAGLESEATHRGHALSVAASNASYEEEHRQIARLVRDGVEGIVLYPTARPEGVDEYLARDFRDVPIVVVDLYEPEMQRPHIIFDNFSAGREMTRLLADRGHQRIGFITFDLRFAYRSLDDRLAGYRRGLADYRLPQDPNLLATTGIPRTSESNDLQSVIDRLVDAGATAIIFPHDFTVEQAIHETDLLDRSRAGELEFAGFDNVQSTPGVRWSTTNPDFSRMGELAGDMLLSDTTTPTLERILACPLVQGDRPSTDLFLFPSAAPTRRRLRGEPVVA